jgi:hypothetical protein
MYESIARKTNRRFATYWCYRSALCPEAESLCKLESAERVQIRDADSFFVKLEENVNALVSMSSPHPLSSPIAVATLKSYLTEDRHRIRLNDLAVEEAERLRSKLFSPKYSLAEEVDPNTLEKRVASYEADTGLMVDLMATGCLWGENSHIETWAKCLSRIANCGTHGNGLVVWLNLRMYPGLLLLYAGGIAALSGGKPDTFAALMKTTVRPFGGKAGIAAIDLHPNEVLQIDYARLVPRLKDYILPFNHHLHEFFRESLSKLLHIEDTYNEWFDSFEYLRALVYADLSPERINFWVPPCYFSSGRHFLDETSVIYRVQREIDELGQDWPLLRSGLFSNSLDRLKEIKGETDTFLLGNRRF